MGYKKTNVIASKSISRDVFAYIYKYIKSHQYAPSVEEICIEVGITRSTARKHIDNLIEQGVLETDHDGRGRTIRIGKRVKAHGKA